MCLPRPSAFRALNGIHTTLGNIIEFMLSIHAHHLARLACPLPACRALLAQRTVALLSCWRAVIRTKSERVRECGRKGGRVCNVRNMWRNTAACAGQRSPQWLDLMIHPRRRRLEWQGPHFRERLERSRLSIWIRETEKTYQLASLGPRYTLCMHFEWASTVCQRCQSVTWTDSLLADRVATLFACVPKCILKCGGRPIYIILGHWNDDTVW